jgi:tetratricopeptide (TPR) repeat protein
MRSLSIVLLLSMLAGCATPASGPSSSRTPIDQVPMYGGMDRNAYPDLKRADEQMIAGASAALGSRENASKAWVNRGFELYQKDDNAGAMRRFNQAWLLNPDNPEVYWGFAVVLNDQRRYCDGVKMIDLAYSKGPIQAGFVPDAALMYSGCAMETNAADTETRRKYVARSDELFAEAVASPLVKKDYTLFQWTRAMYFRGDYRGAWEKVAQYRRETGKEIDPALLRELSAKLPEPK